jgi:hypothetical protein
MIIRPNIYKTQTDKGQTICCQGFARCKSLFFIIAARMKVLNPDLAMWSHFYNQNGGGVKIPDFVDQAFGEDGPATASQDPNAINSDISQPESQSATFGETGESVQETTQPTNFQVINT